MRDMAAQDVADILTRKVEEVLISHEEYMMNNHEEVQQAMQNWDLDRAREAAKKIVVGWTKAKAAAKAGYTKSVAQPAPTPAVREAPRLVRPADAPAPAANRTPYMPDEVVDAMQKESRRSKSSSPFRNTSLTVQGNVKWTADDPHTE